MPKAVIRSTKPLAYTKQELDDRNDAPERYMQAVVGWTPGLKNEYVQLRLEVEDFLPGTNEAFAIELDRRQINELIENLRRARNGIFGKDE